MVNDVTSEEGSLREWKENRNQCCLGQDLPQFDHRMAERSLAKFLLEPSADNSAFLLSEILHSSKKELPPSTKALMEPESILLSEISQEAKDKYHMISPISGT